jgi:hypothetical protein
MQDHPRRSHYDTGEPEDFVCGLYRSAVERDPDAPEDILAQALIAHFLYKKDSLAEPLAQHDDSAWGTRLLPFFSGANSWPHHTNQ